MTTGVPVAIETLTSEEPSYEELAVLYQELRTGTGDSAEETVSERALAEVIREIIEYLDFVEEEMEKSVGISRAAERERVLDTLEEPEGETPVERIHDIVCQWETFECHRLEDIREATKSGVVR